MIFVRIVDLKIILILAPWHIASINLVLWKNESLKYTDDNKPGL